MQKSTRESDQGLQIPGFGHIQEYNFHESGSLELNSGPRDIFLFCMREGTAQLQVSFIPHPLELHGEEAIFLAFPRDNWHIRIVHEPSAVVYVVRMNINQLHKLINPAFDTTQLETTPRVNMKDLMKLIPVNPSLLICFDQLLHHKMQPPYHAMFEQAKSMEIFSLLMETAFSRQTDVCPVILSPVIESKIHQVRRHIISRLDEVPDPDKLAVTYSLPRTTLREGYKFVYGKTIHQYHADHKLESAMQMLNSGEWLVKEIAFRIGYQNPSHFISAFKKKYGFTPKQYLKREQVQI